MLFNSLQFAIFFIIVYSLYLIFNHKWQNRLLLVASYVFYGSWDWRFLSLIFISTVLDYFCGLKIYQSTEPRKRKIYLFISLCGNLSILAFFKYFNFFSSNLQFLLENFGFAAQPRFLEIILPVGISFYTFQTMSYTIDIYRKKLEPTHRFLDFALFVSFFPQLVAGPIERATHLLPQMLNPRKVTPAKFYEGCYRILWGLYQKMFIADNLAKLVDRTFTSSPPYNGATVLLSLYAFAFQIFCDFAGYSNIARGLGKCMGFEIMVNFRIPYFSANPREFWQRWHISLSSWLKDYLYIPLGGNRRGNLLTYRNLAITMILGGLWHGAAWNFILWGVFWAGILILYHISQPLLVRIGVPAGHLIGKLWNGLKILLFFHLVCLGWLIFRAQSLRQILEMIEGLFLHFNLGGYIGALQDLSLFAIYTALLLAIQYFQFRKGDLEIIRKWPGAIKILIYLAIFYSILILGVRKPQYFIYFQF